MPDASFGPFLSLLAFVGHHWLLWAFADLRWPSLAVVGLRWPSLAFVGRHWLPWAFVSRSNKNKILKNEKETHLGPKRRQTRRLGPFSSSWAFIGLHWPSLATQWLLWAFVSDGHGFTHPHGIAGTGVTGTGAGSKCLTRTEPAPVMRVYGFNCRFLLGMGGMVPNLIQLYSLFLTQLRHLNK